MPAKPRQTKAKAPPKQRVRRTATVHRHVFADTTDMPSRIVGGDEKRELILEHAARRRAKDPVQVASLWAGVAVTMLVVMVAWGWVMIPRVWNVLASPLDGTSVEIIDKIKNMPDTGLESGKESLGAAAVKTTEALNGLVEQAKAQQTVLDGMAQAINSTSTGVSEAGQRNDVFIPSKSTTGSAGINE